MDKQSFIHNLRLILDPYDALRHLECDGLTQVIHRVLSDQQLQHTIYIGQVIDKTNSHTIPIHYWIDAEEDVRIDYRARMWLGETPDIPHGVFHPVDYLMISYEGSPIELALFPDFLIQELIRPYKV
jgi:hypothetical protein